MLDLRQLQALTAVAQTGSVARAAKQLGWSQPSVDYHLRNLDRLCGTSGRALDTRVDADDGRADHARSGPADPHPVPAGAARCARACAERTDADEVRHLPHGRL